MSYQSYNNISLAQRPSLSYTSITAQGKPTQIFRGAHSGFSLPIYNSDNEELFVSIKTPRRWDGYTDIILSVHIWLTSAEDVGDKFRLQFNWAKSDCDDILSDTTTEALKEITILTDKSSQYQVYCVDFTISATTFTEGDILSGVLRRIASTGTEISGEVCVFAWDLEFKRDKQGVPFN
jgi:hypothetical protein